MIGGSMKNKYLITIIIPTIETEFNVYVPNNKKMGTIKNNLINSIKELSSENFSNRYPTFIDRDTGKVYANDVYVKDSGIKNGSKIIVM